MDIQEIDVFVTAAGNVTLQVRGVQGRRCLSLTEGLEQWLGADISSRQMRPEADADGDGQGISWQVDDSQSIGTGE